MTSPMEGGSGICTSRPAGRDAQVQREPLQPASIFLQARFEDLSRSPRRLMPPDHRHCENDLDTCLAGSAR